MRFVYAMVALGICAIFFKVFNIDVCAEVKVLSTAIVIGGLLSGCSDDKK